MIDDYGVLNGVNEELLMRLSRIHTPDLTEHYEEVKKSSRVNELKLTGYLIGAALSFLLALGALTGSKNNLERIMAAPLVVAGAGALTRSYKHGFSTLDEELEITRSIL